MIHIILPAFNEETGLGLVLEGIARSLADGRYRVWVIDDGSTDGTARVADHWRGRIPLTRISHPRNRGMGAALQTGFSAFSDAAGPSDIAVVMDADHTQPPQIIPRLTDPIEKGEADIVIASRFAPGGRTVGVPWFRRLTSFGASVLFRTLAPVPGVRDFTCGYRALSAELIQKGRKRHGDLVTENGFAAAAELLMKLAALRPRIREVPLILRYDRKPTPSKMPVGSTIRKVTKILIQSRHWARGGSSAPASHTAHPPETSGKA